MRSEMFPIVWYVKPVERTQSSECEAQILPIGLDPSKCCNHVRIFYTTLRPTDRGRTPSCMRGEEGDGSFRRMGAPHGPTLISFSGAGPNLVLHTTVRNPHSVTLYGMGIMPFRGCPVPLSGSPLLRKARHCASNSCFHRRH